MAKELTLEQKIDKILTQNETLLEQQEKVVEQQEAIIEALNNLSRDGSDYETGDWTTGS